MPIWRPSGRQCGPEPNVTVEPATPWACAFPVAPPAGPPVAPVAPPAPAPVAPAAPAPPAAAAVAEPGRLPPLEAVVPTCAAFFEFPGTMATTKARIAKTPKDTP